MLRRKGFVLGAIVAVGVLAAAGAVNAGSGVSRRVALSGESGDVPSQGLLDAFSTIDRRLQRLIDDVQAGRVKIEESFKSRLDRIAGPAGESLLREAWGLFPKVWGCDFSVLFRALVQADDDLDTQIERVTSNPETKLFSPLGWAGFFLGNAERGLKDSCSTAPADVRAAMTKLEADTKALDKHAEEGKVRGKQLVTEMKTLRTRKETLVRTRFPDVFGSPYRFFLDHAVAMEENALNARVEFALRDPEKAIAALEKVMRQKVQIETVLHQPPQHAQQVTISEDDTWAHNTDLKKSRICINVRTTPPQAFVAAKLTGPGGFIETTPGKEKLHADGTGQIRAIITRAGAYTKTLWVYDANGNQTAAVTKTFTVADPPQDGPVTTPACPKPTQ